MSSNVIYLVVMISYRTRAGCRSEKAHEPTVAGGNIVVLRTHQ